MWRYSRPGASFARAGGPHVALWGPRAWHLRPPAPAGALGAAARSAESSASSSFRHTNRAHAAGTSALSAATSQARCAASCACRRAREARAHRPAGGTATASKIAGRSYRRDEGVPSCTDPTPAGAHSSPRRRRLCSAWLRRRPGAWARPLPGDAVALPREAMLLLRRCAWSAAWRTRRSRRSTCRGAPRRWLRRRVSRSRPRGGSQPPRAVPPPFPPHARAAALRPRRARTRARQAEQGQERRGAVERDATRIRCQGAGAQPLAELDPSAAGLHAANTPSKIAAAKYPYPHCGTSMWT